MNRVLAQWDSEAGAWVAESDNVPGLVAEAESPNLLREKPRVLIPELLELNGVLEKAPAPCNSDCATGMRTAA